MRQGFTLIELSIVLVIIGLIVGGVLIGRDMIANAEIRAQVSQMEQIEAAIGTFRNKYNYLAGDMPNATNFGLGACGGFSGNGDGDGRLTYDIASEDRKVFCHLFNAGLVSHTSADGYNGATLAIPAKGKNRLISAFALSFSSPAYGPSRGYFFYLSGNPTDVVGLSVSAQDAYNMDAKMDDGMPATGKVAAFSTDAVTYTAGAAGSANCAVSTVTPNVYNTTYLTVPICALGFKMNLYQ